MRCIIGEIEAHWEIKSHPCKIAKYNDMLWNENENCRNIGRHVSLNPDVYYVSFRPLGPRLHRVLRQPGCIVFTGCSFEISDNPDLGLMFVPATLRIHGRVCGARFAYPWADGD